MASSGHTLMVFVDGLGLGKKAPGINPLESGACPHLHDLIVNHAVPVDACMGVDGLPQSATGQTSLLTGVNAQEVMGRHIEGFPGPGLCRIIKKENIFSRHLALGLTATFANGYYLNDPAEARLLRLRSVTTVATLAAFGGVRDLSMIERNEAVCHDLVRQTLRDRGYRGPTITIEEAAGHLVNIANHHDFTLFEFFLTDRAGHSGDMGFAKDVLGRLDQLLAHVLRDLDTSSGRLILTSDHGNIEDMSICRHTTNPVPFVVLGKDAEELLPKVASLADVTPALLGLCD